MMGEQRTFFLLLAVCLASVQAKTATLYGDSSEYCTNTLRFDTDGALVVGITPGVRSSAARYLISDCYMSFRTRNKRAIYRIKVEQIVINDPFTYVAIYDGNTPAANIIDYLRQGSRVPPAVLVSTGNTVRLHISTDRPSVYINSVNFVFQAVFSESTPEERCRGYPCYNQSACVAWSLCNDGVDNCFDGSDEDTDNGPPSAGASRNALQRRESEEWQPNYSTTNFLREQRPTSQDAKDSITPEPLSLVDS